MGEATPGRIGVREVAAHAGVSTQTVSRVINGSPNIRPETRSRVVAAMELLGYRLNNAARSLGTATTRTLGALASDATLYGPSIGIAQLEAVARDAGRWVATAYADADDPVAVATAIEHLLAQGVDGVVVLAPHTETLEIARAAASNVRVVAMHTGSGAERQEDAAGLVVEHLVTLGHRRIAQLAGPAEWSEAAARDRGVRRALATAGLPAGPSWVGDWSAASGFARAAEIAAAVRAAAGPTAVVVANDQMALGLIAGLAAVGLRVPDDVSVAGFDDNPDAAFYLPALTTVRLDLAGEARRALFAALSLAEDSVPAAPTLVVRASTASPR